MRTALAREFAGLHPAVIRGNASEIGALAGGSGGRGVDSTATTDEVADVAAEVARQYGTVVAMSGEIDLITDGTRIVRVASGTPDADEGHGCGLRAWRADRRLCRRDQRSDPRRRRRHCLGLRGGR